MIVVEAGKGRDGSAGQDARRRAPGAGEGPKRSNPWAVDATAGRLIGTRHPWLFIGAGAVEMVAGVWVFTSSLVDQYSVGFRAAAIALFIASGLATAWPGLWSRRHRAQAARAADRNWREQADFVREHPVVAFVVMPLLAGAATSLRAGRFWAHPSTGDRVLLGAGAVVLGVLVQGGITVATRRHLPRRRRRSTLGNR